MKKLLSIVATLAVIATVAVSCNPNKERVPAVLPDNSYVLDKTTSTPLVWAGVQNNTEYFAVYLATVTPASIDLPVSVEGLSITIAANQLGEWVALGADYASASLNGVDITAARIKVSIEDGNVNVELEGKLNGKYFDAQFGGAFVALEPEPEVLEYDETLQNQYQYNGGKKVPIDYAAFADESGDWLDGLRFFFADDEMVARCISVYIDKVRLGEEIKLIEDPSYADYWEFKFWDDLLSIEYEGYGVEATDIVDGKMIVTTGGNIVFPTVTMKLVVKFSDGTILRAKYTGAAENWSDDGSVDVDMLVGNWNVAETWIASSAASANNHTITVTKVNDTTFDIDKFTGRALAGAGDKIRATLNAENKMVIATNSVLSPTWNPTYTTCIIPYNVSTPLANNYNQAFPPQTFVRDGATITMTMATGTVNVTISGVSYRYTYMVGGITGGTVADGYITGGTFAGTFGYASRTVWTKTLTPPTAAPLLESTRNTGLSQTVRSRVPGHK